MRSLASLLFYLLHKIAPAEWIAVILMLWWGYFRSARAPGLGEEYWWWTGAVLLALLSLTARAMHHAIFVAEERPGELLNVSPPPEVTQGAATGFAHQWAHELIKIPLPYLQVNQSVQIRWLKAGRPPALAILAPAGLDPTLRFPVDHARVWSLWYPGTTVRVGRLYVAGGEYPALELSFLGQRTFLTVESDEEAEAIRAALTA